MTLLNLTALSPEQPSLYRLAADGQTLDFIFASCPACEKLTFPADAPGCMHCGSSLESADLVTQPGEGTLLEFVTLHVPLTPGMSAPRIAGDVRIAEDVVEEGVIGCTDESLLSPGMPLRAIAVPLPSGTHFGCRFMPHVGVDA